MNIYVYTYMHTVRTIWEEDGSTFRLFRKHPRFYYIPRCPFHFPLDASLNPNAVPGFSTGGGGGLNRANFG